MPSLARLARRALSPRIRRRWMLRRVAVRSAAPVERVLPDLLVIGAMRGGTSSLYKYLEAHPDVVSSIRKEVEYFSIHYSRGEPWYRAHFPASTRAALHERRTGSPLLSFEASPYYLFHPLAPVRARSTVPEAKLVTLLRDPVERAHSHYRLMRRIGIETLSFDEAIREEKARLRGERERLIADASYRSIPHHRFSYVSRGLYAEQMEGWLACFPRSQLLVIRSEDLFTHPDETYARVLGFLGLRPWSLKEFRNHSYQSGGFDHEPLDPDAYAGIAELFSDDVARLSRLLDDDLSWELTT